MRQVAEIGSLRESLKTHIFATEMEQYFLQKCSHSSITRRFSFYLQRDQNANEIFDENAGNEQDKLYYENCDSSVWMRSCEQEVIEPLRSNNVIGNVPKWLKGTLLRNGPGNLKVGEYRFQHLFDSSALLHR